MNAQTELKELAAKEEKIYARLGRQVYEANEGEGHPEIKAELELLITGRREAEEQARSCPNCGNVNPEGTNFCSECGTKLAPPVAKRFCSNCGSEIAAGYRFCNACGTKTE